jgi:cytochrome c-type biogenesis protein CcmH/NrfG
MRYCLGLAMDSDASSDTDAAWEAAQEGADLIADEQPERAVGVLEALVAREPQNPYAYFFLGSAHYELQHYDKALAAYVAALKLAPTYLGAMINAGHTLRMLGRYDQAIRMAHEVNARKKDDPDALYLLGASHFARGDTSQATAYLERFLHTNPELEAAIEAEGMLQVLRGEIVSSEPSDDPD